MRYSVDKIFSFASFFEKKAQSKPLSVLDYENKGLLNVSSWVEKVAKPGFSLMGTPYPKGYVGGYNPDGSGLPINCDDDVPLDEGMDSNQVTSWFHVYMGETDPAKLFLAASLLKQFPLAAKALIEKATYIKNNTK